MHSCVCGVIVFVGAGRSLVMNLSVCAREHPAVFFVIQAPAHEELMG